VTVVNRELVGPVVSKATTDFQVLYRLRCNPGSKATFNWLSGMALNYEMYKFKKLRFVFETRSPSTREGALIMSPDYDAADNPDSAFSEQAIFSNKGTVDDALWKNNELHLKVENMNRLYKSHVNMSDQRFASSVQDEKTIDCAQVFICTDCLTASNNGKLFVEYIVELSIPQSRTEIEGGGGYLALPASSVNLDRVITGVPLINKLATQDPLLRVPSIFPTSQIGTFTKDFEGTVNTLMTGTGLGSIGNMKVTNVNTPDYTGAGTVYGPLAAIVNGSFSQNFATYAIKAVAGDILKFAGPVSATGISSVNNWIGATPLSTLI